MDFQSTTKFESKKYPGAVFYLRNLSWKMRRDTLAAYRRLTEDLTDEKNTAELTLRVMDFNRSLWEMSIAKTNVTLDGVELSLDDLFMHLPEDLVNEVLAELNLVSRALGVAESADESDDKAIEEAEKRIAELRRRIAERKNSVPQSSVPQKEDTTTAEIVTPTPKQQETAQVIPISNGPSSS